MFFHVRTEEECASDPPGCGVRKATATGGMSLAQIGQKSNPPRPPCRGVNVSHALLAAAGAWHFCTAWFQPLMFIFSMQELSLFTTLFHNQSHPSWIVQAGVIPALRVTGRLCLPVSSSLSSHFCLHRSSLCDKQHLSLKAVFWKVAWILVRISYRCSPACLAVLVHSPLSGTSGTQGTVSAYP